MTPGSALKTARDSRRWTQGQVCLELKKRGVEVEQYEISRFEKSAYLPEWIVGNLDMIFGGANWRKKADAIADAVLERSAAFEAAKQLPAIIDAPSSEAALAGYRFLEIPHLGIVNASQFNFSFDLPPEHFTVLAIKGPVGVRHAIIGISGNCMADKIEDGDEILVRETNYVEDGDIAIVCFDGECTLKRVYRRKDGVELRPDNKEFKSKTYASNKVQVLAKVIKIMKDPGRKP